MGATEDEGECQMSSAVDDADDGGVVERVVVCLGVGLYGQREGEEQGGSRHRGGGTEL